MYQKSHGTERQWCWDEPTINQDHVTLSAAEPGRRQDMLSVAGQWNNARVTASFPAEWLDIVFELWAVVGKAEFVIRTITPRTASFQSASAGIISVELFDVGGFVVDKWIVKAVSDGNELGGDTEMSLMAWGTEPDAVRKNGPQLQRFNNNGDLIPSPGTAVFVVGGHRMHRIMFRNTLADNPPNTRFIMLFDQPVLPVIVGAAPPITPRQLDGEEDDEFIVPPDGNFFRNGLVVAVSTSDIVFAESAGDEVLATVWYTQP